MSFPPSAACEFLDLPPVNLRNLHLHLTKNPFAGRLPHLCGVIRGFMNRPSFPRRTISTKTKERFFMGWQFRKSINLGKGFKLNISKSGVGLSGGVKGARERRSPWRAAHLLHPRHGHQQHQNLFHQEDQAEGAVRLRDDAFVPHRADRAFAGIHPALIKFTQMFLTGRPRKTIIHFNPTERRSSVPRKAHKRARVAG